MNSDISQGRPIPYPAAPIPVARAKARNLSKNLARLLVLAAAVGVFVFRDYLLDLGAGPERGTYQAVFLTNGQVYFGKLSSVHGDYLVLRDIYYLRDVQASSTEFTGTQSGPESKVSLIKLGEELHNPEDQMQISRAQLLFYENLKKDGKVVATIEGYKQKLQSSPAK